MTDFSQWLQGPSPWPNIRRDRIKKLLPPAMEMAGVEVWVIICRENALDPLAMHVGGENAGGTAAFVFIHEGQQVQSTVFSPWGEVVGLQEMGLHDRINSLSEPGEIWSQLALFLQDIAPKNIAVNSSALSIADGLSWYQRKQMEESLGPELAKRLISSEELVFQWLSVKLPREVEIMARAGELTVQIQEEAYSRVVPGKTRDSDLGAFIQERVEELGVGYAWAPGHNPAVNSGFPRGHAGASDKVIVPGDFIQTDFGIKVFDVWCTDYQRFAYVLAPGESGPPAGALEKWNNAIQGHRIALQSMKPGVRGYDVDLAQRRWMEKTGSLPVKWGTGHPVGYWAHDIGPALTGAQRETPPPAALKTLRPGQTFAFDGFFAWEEKRPYGTGEKQISVEEIAVVEEDGARYLIPPQEDLILISSGE